MKLIAISKSAEPEEPIANLPEMAREILEQTRSLYSAVGYAKPWVGYFAVDDSECIGFCGFKSAPKNGRVETGYATVPLHEGRGVATAMARRLIELAAQADPKVIIAAQTLPEENASTSVLKKLGFVRHSEVMHPEDGRVWEWRLPKS